MEDRGLAYTCLDGNDAGLRQAEQALAAAGLTLGRDNATASDAPAIVFFGRPSPELIDRVRQQSRERRGRVLAVALSEEALRDCRPWPLLRAGAADVLGGRLDAGFGRVVAERVTRWGTVDELIASPLVRQNLIGRSPAWITALRQVVEAAHFTDSSLLITGESGTGKELVARLIHSLDRRENKAKLVVLDCTTVVPDLSGSEFFGHERGAFTNAVESRDGAFSLANGGTLFLDEVGDLPLRLQAELLRVVQERTYKRVGGNQWKQTDFRLVCATNRDLLLDEAQGRFRRDFYYRIAALPIRLPPLRERSEDVIPLARHFWQQLRPQEEPPDFEAPVRDYLVTKDYPGNIRDLKQLVTRMSYRHVGWGAVTVGDIPEDDRPPADNHEPEWRDAALERALRRALARGMTLKEIGRAAEDEAERIALLDEEGNLQRAARKLGVTDRALQMRRANRRGQGPAEAQRADQG